VLFRGPQLIAAISDERLSRVKNDGGRLSDLAIDAVLAIAQRARNDVDRLALLYTFFPEEYFVRETWWKEAQRKFSRFKRRLKGAERPQMLLSNLLERLQRRGKHFEAHMRRAAFLGNERFSRARPAFHDHHDCHALPAAFYSGFRRAAIITLDGNGDWNVHHTSGGYANGKLTRHYTSDSHGTSAGLFYSHITRLLGFKALRHEGKVVGLAALGNPSVLYDAYSRALRVSADGKHLDSEFRGTDRAADLRRYKYLDEVSRGHSREDISAAAQKVLEDVVVTLVRNFLIETGHEYVALNGGVFANVKLNQRIMELPQVKQVFVFPAMSDTGNSVGAALFELEASEPGAIGRHAGALEHVYWGPGYTDDEIAAELTAAKLPLRRLSENELTAVAAKAIHAGRVVGWFQGRMEFGPRALGNRSMLARPTEAAINDWLNQRLDRSEFMPFAPSVLEEHAAEIFADVDKARHTARFMTITFDVKPEWRTRIPAVVHVDGTARPQLVNPTINPLYYNLIRAYYDLSGIPLVLNTSFNVHEEPIVCKPRDAITAFLERRVDCLGIGHYWLSHD
jgi:carbamoyltransferase